ncbi:MAG: tRNA lysidine(34) synthetase TilS [Gemmatimonadota bacterium]
MKRPHGAGLPRRLARHLVRSGLLRDVDHAIVAFSGGLDSTVLLHLLHFHMPALRVTAAHFDHALRAGSRADCDWARGICEAWSVPFVSARAAAPTAGETRARAARYAFLQRVEQEHGAGAILTAHHADDQAETVLFRLARGTGPAGLAGIPARRGSIARPLLPFARDELLAYAAHVRLSWREDPTNTDTRYARNRIRHIVLPALEAARPGAARRIAATAERFAASEQAWHGVVAEASQAVVSARREGAFTLARDRLLAYHPHVRARVLRLLADQLGGRVDRAGTRVALDFAAAGVSGGSIDLGGGVRLTREFDRLLLRVHATDDDRAAAVDTSLEIRTAAPGAGTFVLGGRTCEAHWGPASAAAGSAQTASFDPSSLRFPLELRAWRAGDRIRLAYGSKKLKKLFQERRIGRSGRRHTAVLADAAGDVLWVVGVARAAAPLPQRSSAFVIAVGRVSGGAGERESG